MCQVSPWDTALGLINLAVLRQSDEIVADMQPLDEILISGKEPLAGGLENFFSAVIWKGASAAVEALDSAGLLNASACECVLWAARPGEDSASVRDGAQVLLAAALEFALSQGDVEPVDDYPARQATHQVWALVLRGWRPPLTVSGDLAF